MGAGFENPEKASSGSITPVTSRTTTAPRTAKVGEKRSVTSTAMVAVTTTSVSHASQVMPPPPCICDWSFGREIDQRAQYGTYRVATGIKVDAHQVEWWLALPGNGSM